MTNRIFFNVTSSYNWQGAPVGIIRTEEEIAKKLYKKYSTRLKLCIWNGKFFKNIDYKNYENIIKNQVDVAPVPQKITLKKKWIFPILPRRLAAKNVAQAVLSLSPNCLRPFINKSLILAKGVYQKSLILNKTPSLVINTEDQKHSDIDPFEIFEEGDVLVSAGLEWGSGVYEKFYSLRVKKKVRIISFCYDIIPVLYPQYCVSDVASMFKSYFIELGDGSDVIMCISQRSMDDLRNLLDELGARIPHLSLIRLGCDSIHTSGDVKISPEVISVLKNDFILFVSTVERRKNHEILYRAYHRLLENNKNLDLPKLVFVGMKGWGVEELLQDIRLDPVVQNKIVMLGRVSDEELNLLYEKTLFTLFPSLYEGWGLGVAESLIHGKFVLASSTGSLPEVGRDLIWYLDPWDVNAWAKSIKYLVENKKKLNELEQRIKKDYQPYSWQNSLDDLASVIDKLSTQ